MWQKYGTQNCTLKARSRFVFFAFKKSDIHHSTYDGQLYQDDAQQYQLVCCNSGMKEENKI